MQELRKPEPAVPDQLGALVERASGALDRILEVVPEEDLDQAREVIAALRRAAPAGIAADDDAAPPAEAKERMREKKEAAQDRLQTLLLLRP